MTAYELDHLAIAVPDWRPPAQYLANRFGGEWKHGFELPAFNPCHLAFADDMRIELLAPGTDEASFIRRYLASTGGQARPHHITFKVKDVEETIAASRDSGFEPIQLRLDNDVWREGFLHPKDTGLGFLAQFVQAEHDPGDLESSDPLKVPRPAWLPTGGAPPAAIPFIFGRLPAWGSARRVLIEILGGAVTDVEADEGWSTTRFSWDQGADLVLTTHPDDGVPHGIEALGIGPPPADAGGGYRSAVDAGTPVPELGVKVATPT
jgi:hypothetical protein